MWYGIYISLIIPISYTIFKKSYKVKYSKIVNIEEIELDDDVWSEFY